MDIVETTNYYLEESANGISKEDAIEAFQKATGSFAQGDVLRVFQAIIQPAIDSVQLGTPIDDVYIGDVQVPLDKDAADKIYSLISQYIRRGNISDKQIGLLKFVVMTLVKMYGSNHSIKRLQHGLNHPSQQRRDHDAFKKAEMQHELGWDR